MYDITTNETVSRLIRERGGNVKIYESDNKVYVSDTEAIDYENKFTVFGYILDTEHIYVLENFDLKSIVHKDAEKIGEVAYPSLEFINKAKAEGFDTVSYDGYNVYLNGYNKFIFIEDKITPLEDSEPFVYDIDDYNIADTSYNYDTKLQSLISECHLKGYQYIVGLKDGNYSVDIFGNKIKIIDTVIIPEGWFINISDCIYRGNYKPFITYDITLQPISRINYLLV